jgi:hypothetical protein
MTNPPPALSRRLLSRVLGLPNDASPEQIEAATPRLLIQLLRRLASADETEARALRQEIADLEASSTYFQASQESDSTSAEKVRRQKLLGALLGAGLTLAVLIAYAAGFRVVKLEEGAVVSEPAQLVLVGRLPGATLRVLDADREELLLKVPAEGAQIELTTGRYALDVSREDCPDHWTRSIFFEEGATYRYEPLICRGEGQLTVRSNVSRDRLQIDGLELGPTREKPHLLGVGDHEVRVEKAGYAPFVGKVRIRPGEELTLRAELIPESEAGPPVGRPMPVEKVSPSAAPGTAVAPEPSAAPNLREEFASGAQGEGLSREDLLQEDLLEGEFESHTFTEGGSTRWHDRMSSQLLEQYDLDRSGQIDRLEESEAISCRVWREIERDFDGGGLGLSMARYYGFDGSEWHPNALGFSEAHRSAVFEKMKECGLQN